MAFLFFPRRVSACTRPLYDLPFVVVQSLSHAWLFVAPGTAALQASLASITSWSLLKGVDTARGKPHGTFTKINPLVVHHQFLKRRRGSFQ